MHSHLLAAGGLIATSQNMATPVYGETACDYHTSTPLAEFTATNTFYRCFLFLDTGQKEYTKFRAWGTSRVFQLNLWGIEPERPQEGLTPQTTQL